MSRIKYLIIFFVLSALFGKCQNEDKLDYPIVQTGDVFKIDSANVIFAARIFNRSDSIVEYGFIWELMKIGIYEPERSYKVSKTGAPAGDYFEQKISSSLQKGRSYNVRAFIKTSGGIVYGRNVTFQVLKVAPCIFTAIDPNTVTWGDTISLIGRNFGFNKTDATLSAGKTGLTIINLSDSIITFKLPNSYNLISSPLTLTVLGNSYTTSLKMVLAPPQVISIEPDTVAVNAPVIITGKYFSPYLDLNNYGWYTNINFNGTYGYLKSVTSKYISLDFPSGITEGNVSVIVDVIGQKVKYEGKLYYSGPRIKNFEPSAGKSGSTVIIKGKYFALNYTSIQLNYVNAAIQSVNDSVIIFIVPNNIQGGLLDLKVIVDNKSSTASQKFDRLAPVISDIVPDTAVIGDTISIYGDRFSDIASGNIVKFGTTQAEVVTASIQLLKVKVPSFPSPPSCKIFVSVGSETSVCARNFVLKL